MGKQPFHQTRRAKSAQQTRQRILAATRTCLTNTPLLALSVESIAQEAKVARSTIYDAFGSRLGLMQALEQDVLQRGGFEDIQAAFALPDARATLEKTLAASVRFYLSERVVLRALTLQALINPDASAIFRELMDGRVGGMKHLAHLLAEQSHLRADVSEEEAGDVLSLLTDFALFEQFFTERGQSPEGVLRRLTVLARSVLVDG
jgi:AcrR family transcriptional regulator